MLEKLVQLGPHLASPSIHASTQKQVQLRATEAGAIGSVFGITRHPRIKSRDGIANDVTKRKRSAEVIRPT